MKTSLGNARPLQTLLAAVCTLAVALPLLSLFTPNTWIRAAVLVVAVVAVAGAITRAYTARAWVVIAVQAIALLATLHLRFLGAQARFGLPSADSPGAALDLLRGALDVVQQYAAPAPADESVTFAIALVIGLTALLVDYLAVTRRAPAAAGIPLLAAFLASATNSGEGLALRYFLVPGVAWLALLGEDAIAQMRRWGAHARGQGGLLDPTMGFAARGRAMGLAALAAAVVLPTVLPLAPPTFLAQGLGRADTSRGVGTSVELSSTLDLSRSLGDRSTAPILTYRTDARSPAPLRVDVLERYSNGVWTAGSEPLIDTAGQLPALVSQGPSIRSRTVIEDNRVRSPQLAIPAEPVALSIPAQGWRLSPAGVVRTTQQFSTFTVDSVTSTPQPSQFTSVQGSPDPSALFLDDEGPRISALTDRIVPDGASPLESAQRIQQYLRGSQFSYSLDLPGPTTDTNGRSVQYGPLEQFLVTKRGYCVQFASAMIMMARTRGIPARMAIGYLPGVLKGQTWQVTAKDAHAWPELWFQDLGWVRFEPTPGVRAGLPPTYTLAQTVPGASPSASTPTRPTPTPAASARPETDQGATPVIQASPSLPVRVITEHGKTLALLLLVGLALLAVPLAGLWARRSAGRKARDEAERAEAQWRSLLARLDDVGVAPTVGATPRQAGREIAQSAYLEGPSEQAMTRMVATVERARYAPPGSAVSDARADADLIWRRAYAVRRRRDRLAARLWPSEGRAWWIGAARRLRARPSRAWARLRR